MSKKLRDIPNLDANGVIFEKIYELTVYDNVVPNLLHFQNVDEDSFMFCYILHDRDVKVDNTPIKPHYHVLLKFKNRRRITTVAEQFGVPVNMIEWKSDFKLSVQYLVHLHNFNKFSYDINELISNFNVRPYFVKATESEEVAMLIDFIASSKPTLKELSQFALDNSIWGSFRRNYRILLDMFSEDYKYYRIG